MKYILALCAFLIGCGTVPADVIDDTNNVVQSGLAVQDSAGSTIGHVLGVTGTYGQQLVVRSPEGYMFVLNDASGFVGGEEITGTDCGGVEGTSWGRAGSSCEPMPRPVVVRVGGDADGWSEASSLRLVGADVVPTGCASCQNMVEAVAFPTSFSTPITLVAE